MKITSFLLLAFVVLLGTMDLKSQAAKCATGTQKVFFPCGGFLEDHCDFHIATGEETYGVYYVPQKYYCCGSVEYDYYATNAQCVQVWGKLSQPAFQRLLEYAKTHELLTATCDGQYLPAQSVLRMPTPASPPQLLERRESISDLGVK
jgi:hypothetical protein